MRLLAQASEVPNHVNFADFRQANGLPAARKRRPGNIQLRLRGRKNIACRTRTMQVSDHLGG